MGSKETTIMGANTRLKGRLEAKGDFVAEGHAEADASVDGTITITNSCRWVGTLRADVVVINGVVEGDIYARVRVDVLDKARVTGCIASPSIAIKQGAIVNGWLSDNEATLQMMLHSATATEQRVETFVNSRGKRQAVG